MPADAPREEGVLFMAAPNSCQCADTAYGQPQSPTTRLPNNGVRGQRPLPRESPNRGQGSPTADVADSAPPIQEASWTVCCSDWTWSLPPTRCSQGFQPVSSRPLAPLSLLNFSEGTDLSGHDNRLVLRPWLARPGLMDPSSWLVVTRGFVQGRSSGHV